MSRQATPARAAASRIGRRAAVVAVVVALGAGALLWHSGRPAAPRNVLVLAIDSQRTDRIGTYGSTRGLTPFLDELAARGVVYEQAYAPSSWTLPTVASLFVGKYPSAHGATRFFTSVRAEETTLAEVMAAHGYTTWGLTTNSVIQPNAGFAQGFERYEMLGELTMRNPKADGGLINDQLLRWLDEEPAAPQRPHFVYLHYMDVHAPYRPHEGITAARDDAVGIADDDLNVRVLTGSRVKEPDLQKRTWDFNDVQVARIADLYDGEVRYQDDVLRRLFAGLEERGFLDNALVIVTADHGEELGVHHTFYHGTSLFDPAIHVPLIIHDAGAAPRRIATPVQIAGIGALIFARIGIERPSSFHIDPVPDAEAPTRDTLVYSELVESGQIYVWQHKQALTGATTKLLVTSDDQYLTIDRAADPDELAPRADDSAPLRAALEQTVASINQPHEPAPVVELDAATQERLRAAGYLEHE